MIEITNPIEGAALLLTSAGAPSAGTSEVQTLTFADTWAGSDTFTLSFDGYTTAAIAWSATNNTLRDNIDAALELLPNIGTGGVTTAVGTMTSGIGTMTVTAAGNIGKLAIPLLVIDATVAGDGTLDVAETTEGVTATGRGAIKGSILTDTTNGVLYINTGTALAPTWTKVGTQS